MHTDRDRAVWTSSDQDHLEELLEGDLGELELWELRELLGLLQFLATHVVLPLIRTSPDRV